MVESLEVHKGLPSDGDIKVVKRYKGLFQYVPIRFQGFVTIDGGPVGAVVHNSDQSGFAMEDRYRRKKSGLVS